MFWTDATLYFNAYWTCCFRSQILHWMSIGNDSTIICIYHLHFPSYDLFWIMFHHFTAPAVFSQVRSPWLKSYDSVWQMNQSEDAGAYSLMDISMLFLALLCLARPAVTPLPSSDSLLTERLFLIAQASLSIFGSFSARHDGRSCIIYSVGQALGISAVHTAGTAVRSSEDWCAVLIKTFDQSGPWLPHSHVYRYHRAAKNSVRAVENLL